MSIRLSAITRGSIGLLITCVFFFYLNLKGQKYECAKKWNVHCVSVQWFSDSIEKGFCQDETMYKIEGRSKLSNTPSTSTPTSHASKPDSK